MRIENHTGEQEAGEWWKKHSLETYSYLVEKEREREWENMLSVTHKLVYRELNKEITRDVTEKEVREAAFN